MHPHLSLPDVPIPPAEFDRGESRRPTDPVKRGGPFRSRRCPAGIEPSRPVMPWGPEQVNHPGLASSFASVQTVASVPAHRSRSWDGAGDAVVVTVDKVGGAPVGVQRQWSSCRSTIPSNPHPARRGATRSRSTTDSVPSWEPPSRFIPIFGNAARNVSRLRSA